VHPPSDNPSRSTPEPIEFVELLDELEDAANGEGLLGASREDCLRHYLASPRAFKMVFRRAMEQGTINPIGMLVWKVRHGEVQRTERALAREAEVEDIPL
jgi:hypothetical protein